MKNKLQSRARQMRRKISELTPALATILKETQDKENIQCENCHTDLHGIVERTLQPMTALSDTYSSLPRNLSNREKDLSESSGPLSLQQDNRGTSAQSYSMDKENTPSAASFFLRAAQKLNLGSKPKTSKRMKNKKNCETEMEDNRRIFLTNFSDLIMRTPPQAPPSLFKNGTIRRGDGHGKVRLILRTVNRRQTAESCLTVDSRKKQVLLRDATPTTDNTRRFEKAARLYSFDNIFQQDSTQQELCAGTLVDLLHTVVNGNDACLMTYGYPKLGKSSIMIGNDKSVENVGIVPCAISWLYQLIDDRKQRTGARFSVRVSAVEVVGKSENLKDLLGEQGNGSMCSSGGTSPSVYLPRERASSIQLSDFTELRAPSAEKAAFYFDAAVTSRTNPTPLVNSNGDIIEDPDERKNSNMIFTLHVYQYMIDKVGTGEIHGGRSRFHLIDLSGCSRKKRSRDTGQGAWLPLSALGNVIVSIANGTKHIPHRDSKMTTLLREAMGSLSARVTMIANVSQDPKHCFETLATCQIASRIHRSRKRKSGYSSTSSSGGDSSCDEKRKHRRRCKPVTPLLRTDTCQSDNVVESEFTSTSAAEESCDTVIYLGPGGRCLSDRDLTDFEHPPQINNQPVPKIIKPSDPLKGKANTPVTNSTLERNNSKNTSPKRNISAEVNKIMQSPKKQIDKLPVPKPIVVNINTQSLLKSPLEEKADSLLKLTGSQKDTKDLKNTTDDLYIASHKTRLSESFKFSDSLPIRSKNKSYSLDTQEINNNNIETKAHAKQLKNKNTERLCQSTNSSPCKRGRSLTSSELRNRSCSLDRTLLNEMSEREENLGDYRSNETISSTATVDNFERQLVSKIAERFAVEEEFSLAKNPPTDFYIDDDLDTIGAELDSTNPLDSLYNRRNTVSRVTIIDESEHRENDVINCNTCIGECVCYNTTGTYRNILAGDFDSAEDTDERTDKELRFLCVRNRNSFSSCDSHLNSPRNFDKHPPSEGVSSGYESMRCESSANIHLSDSSSEKGRSPRQRVDSRTESVNKTIYELDDEIRGINVKDEDKTRFARTSLFRAQIKELISQRQDLKEELQQTLKRLVLNRVPLPDIDERLREISMQSRNTPQVLTRENRILERKVRVCKSHLELVDCLESSTNQRKQSPKKRSPVQKFSAKLKAKLTKTPTSPRKAYKVTSV